jgi:hypothetical protein
MSKMDKCALGTTGITGFDCLDNRNSLTGFLQILVR